MTTMVSLRVAGKADGGFWFDTYYQPWEIDRVEDCLVTVNERQYQGARLFLTSDAADGRLPCVYTTSHAKTVVELIDAARAALNGRTVDQPVRITNWMSQVWVLLLSNTILTIVLHRWAGRIGTCLFELKCADPYWWLP